MFFRRRPPDLSGYSDDELVRLFEQSRDEEHFAELFRRHSRSVFLSANAFLREVGAAEDVTQEAFLQAYRSLETFAGGDFRAWLLRIARNRCIDRWRRRTPETSYDAAPIQADIASGRQTVGTALHFAMLELDSELPCLPHSQRECLRLKGEGYSYEETAVELGCSPDDVRSHLQNGRRTLRIRMASALAEVL